MKIGYIAAFICTLIFSMANPTNADELGGIVDRFYGDLAVIIERNTDSPDLCVAEVEKYYSDNKKTVEKIRAMTEESVAHVMAMMDEREMMTVEELEAFEEQALQDNMERPMMSAEMSRYTEAMEKFIIKHPEQGMKITAKSMELMPALPGSINADIE